MNKNIFLRNLLIFFIIFFIICIILIFTMFNNDNQNEKLSSKTEKEIEHLEEKIIGIMNNLNNINLSNSRLVEERIENKNQNSESNQNADQSNSDTSQSQGSSTSTQGSSGSNSSSNNQQSNTKVDTKFEIVDDAILLKEDESIDWEHIKSNIESIHSTWATLTIDLHSLNVKNEDILNFGSVLNQVTISANNEDKTATLNNLAILYAFFPNYITQISDNNEKINIENVKIYVLNSYALSEQDKWDEMKVQVSNAINYFSNILNSVNENNQNQSKITKIYVMLNELNNSIDLKDKDLYMIKYKNVMDELVNFNYTNKA